MTNDWEEVLYSNVTKFDWFKWNKVKIQAYSTVILHMIDEINEFKSFPISYKDLAVLLSDKKLTISLISYASRKSGT